MTELGYIQRGGAPTACSWALACESGHHAVELLFKGEKKRMVGVREGKIRSVDLDYAWKKRRELDLNRYKLAEILSLEKSYQRETGSPQYLHLSRQRLVSNPTL